MENEKVYKMSYRKIYTLLLNKAEKKSRTKDEVDEIIRWLTGYTQKDLDALMESETTYGDFFTNAPEMNPDRHRIKGVVCGVRVENIEEPLMRDMRYLDKMIDELAKGKKMDKILRK